MKKSRKVFLIIALIFLIILLVIGYDLATRTTWPGSARDHSKQLKK